MSLADQLGLVASTKSTRRSFAILQQSVFSTPETTYQADYKDP